MSSNLHTLGDIQRECEKANSKNILKLLNSETKEKSYELPKSGEIQSSTQELDSKRRINICDSKTNVKKQWNTVYIVSGEKLLHVCEGKVKLLKGGDGEGLEEEKGRK